MRYAIFSTGHPHLQELVIQDTDPVQRRGPGWSGPTVEQGDGDYSLHEGIYMATTGTEAVGRACLMLLRASQLTLGPQGDDLQVGFHVAVSALQLRCLSLVSELIQVPDCTYPETIVGCLDEAAVQTSRWDLAILPPEAVDFIVDLADLTRALGSR